MKSNKKFPNGFTSWFETSIEIAEHLINAMSSDSITFEGRGDYWETIENYSNEFEKLYKGEEWIDKEWFDTLDKFMDMKIKQLQLNKQHNN